MPRLIGVGIRFDRAMIDPPRKDADARGLETIMRAEPDMISYVSRNPAALAGDMKRLYEKYTAVTIQPVDMFP